MNARVCLTCLLPCTLVLLYYSSNIKCDKVIGWTLWAFVLSTVLGLWWLFSSGEYLKLQKS